MRQQSSPLLFVATTHTPCSRSLVTLETSRMWVRSPSVNVWNFGDSFTLLRPTCHLTVGFGNPDIRTTMEAGSSSFNVNGLASSLSSINGAICWVSGKIPYDDIIACGFSSFLFTFKQLRCTASAQDNR